MTTGKKYQVLFIGHIVNDTGVPKAIVQLKGDLVAGKILPGFGAVRAFQLQELLPISETRKSKTEPKE